MKKNPTGKCITRGIVHYFGAVYFIVKFLARRPEKGIMGQSQCLETGRLGALSRLEISNDAAEQSYDEIVQLAARLCDMPIALISLVEKDHQWFKASFGVESNLRQTPRDISFCTHAIAQDDLKQVFVVPDATLDDRFRNSPLVTQSPHVRFYAGAPLITSDGYAIGTLCVLDTRPRHLDAGQLDILRILGRSIVSQMELNRAVAEVDSQTALLSNVISLLPVGVFWKDRNSVFLGCNQTFAKIAGASSPAEVIGKTDFDLPGRRAEANHFLEIDRQVMGTGEPVLSKRETGTDSQGQVHQFEVSKMAMRDAGGQVTGVVGSFGDITKQCEVEDQLREAKTAAEAASSAKSQFLAHMSHEIRTPLNGVIGMAEVLLRKGGLADQQMRYVKMIKSSGDTLLTLVNDILDLSKIEAGKMELSCIDFVPQELIEDVIEMLATKADAKGLELSSQVGWDVPTRLNGDPDRLRQILINLVNNAIKFTARGSVIVRVTTEASSSAQTILRFDVIDTGAGIAPDRLDRLFKSFSQVDASTTRQYGGTGLGLAIAKQLVEMMHGQIGVQSQLGKGSIFWFEAQFKTPLSHGSLRSFATAGGLAGLRALAVDDQLSYREILREQLEGWGFDVTTASDGYEAINLLKAAAVEGRPFNLAITDMLMPGMDGTTLTQAIRSDQTLCRTPVLLLTGMDTPLNEFEATELGFIRCLKKPVRQSQLFDGIVESVASTHSISLNEGDTITFDAPAPSNLYKSEPRLNASVLLAEDNDINQEVAAEILRDVGCRVDIVNNGQAAIDAALAQPYDVILMDCQMPVLDGFSAATKIRELEDQKKLPARAGRVTIIALTANAIQGDKERCLGAGMDRYITKPIDPEALIDAIAEVMGIGQQKAPFIDLPALMNRCRGKANLVEKLLVNFVHGLPGKIEDLKNAITAQDHDRVAQLAHTIKGTSANLALNDLSSKVRCVEEKNAKLEWAAAEAAMNEIESCVMQCVESMPGLIDQVRQQSATRADA